MLVVAVDQQLLDIQMELVDQAVAQMVFLLEYLIAERQILVAEVVETSIHQAVLRAQVALVLSSSKH
jgi:hypothetical protein